MASIEVSHDIDVECDSCGASLDGTFKNGLVKVEPCKKCMDAKYEEGVDDGRSQASSEEE